MPARHLITGRSGEDAARRYLRGLGFRVLDRNWRAPGPDGVELDLVCRDGDCVVFVEVKTRAEGGRGTASEALSPAKRARLVRAAQRWQGAHDQWDAPCRFDLVAVTRTRDGFELEHIEHAFSLSEALGGGDTPWQPW